MIELFDKANQTMTGRYKLRNIQPKKVSKITCPKINCQK